MPIVPDRDNPGWFRGWGVVRNDPWHFVGLFDSQEEAEVEHAKYGADYLVVLGSNKKGTDEFVWFSSDQTKA